MERMSEGIGMISMLNGVGRCFDCRRTSTSRVMSYNMSSDATVRTAAGTSLADKWRLTS